MSGDFREPTEPKDLDAAAKVGVVNCVRKFKDTKERNACVQGIYDFGYVARRKFEGFFSNLDEANAAYHRTIRLCRRRFGAYGTPLMDACDIGAYDVRSMIHDIGIGVLRRKEKK